MSKDLNAATTDEKALAVALIALAGAILAGVIAVLPTVLSLLTDFGDGIALLVIAGILLLLMFSIIFGGRGFAYGPKRQGFLDRFNLQASFGALALVLVASLGGVIYLWREPSNLKVSERVQTLESDLTNLRNEFTRTNETAVSLDEELRALREEVERVTTGTASATDALSDRTAQLEEFLERLRAETSSATGALSESSARLEESIERLKTETSSIGVLSQRVQRVEDAVERLETLVARTRRRSFMRPR